RVTALDDPAETGQQLGYPEAEDDREEDRKVGEGVHRWERSSGGNAGRSRSPSPSRTMVPATSGACLVSNRRLLLEQTRWPAPRLRRSPPRSFSPALRLAWRRSGRRTPSVIGAGWTPRSPGSEPATPENSRSHPRIASRRAGTSRSAGSSS